MDMIRLAQAFNAYSVVTLLVLQWTFCSLCLSNAISASIRIWSDCSLPTPVDEDGRGNRLNGMAEVDDGSYDDRGRQHHILPLASPRGPNRMYAPRDKLNGFDRAPPLARRPVPTGVIRRLSGTGHRAEPKMEGEPATPMPKSLSPLQPLPQR